MEPKNDRSPSEEPQQAEPPPPPPKKRFQVKRLQIEKLEDRIALKKGVKTASIPADSFTSLSY